MSVAPGPPPVPRHLAPQPANFSGYKLDPNPLPSRVIPLAEPLCTSEAPAAGDSAAAASSSSDAAPTSFHALSQKLKANQLVLLRSESTDPQQIGAHSMWYVDHKGVWQVDPPTAGAAEAAGSSAGGSHLVYEFEELENGDGLSFVGVAPCLLLLTRAGGRLTVFLVNPTAGQQLSKEGADRPALTVLFDGSPLCPAPLTPHHATLQSALLSRERDRLFVVLYEYWPQRTSLASKKGAAPGKDAIAFVHEHESDAMRSAGTVAPTQATEGFAAISTDKHALHKLTLVQFAVRDIPRACLGLDAGATAGPNDQTNGAPHLDLVRSFSSVQNCLLPADEMPVQHLHDSNWSAPLGSWLSLPPPELATDATPVHMFVASRVPYLNETESVVHEVTRRQADQESAAKQQRMRDRADEMDTEPVPAPGIGAAAAAAASSAGEPKFTSDTLLSGTHGLKHYAVDNEGDEEDDMDDMESGLGSIDPAKRGLRPTTDVEVQLFDTLGYLLAKRPLHLQTFLFAHALEPLLPGSAKGRSALVGVKQLDDLHMYEVTAAPQIGEGTAVLAAGNVQPSPDASSSASATSAVPRAGIVFTPRFSFAGLGYVQSGKPHKKFFFADPSLSYVVLAEYTKLVYVYGRPPSKATPVAEAADPTGCSAPQYLVQLSGDEEDQGGQIHGVQMALVPMPALAAASGSVSRNAPQGSAAPSLPAKALLYVLTRHACRQFQLPLVDLESPRA